MKTATNLTSPYFILTRFRMFFLKQKLLHTSENDLNPVASPLQYIQLSITPL